MKLIDREELLMKLPNDLPYKASVKRVLIQAPVVDAEPVVRCKNCIHSKGLSAMEKFQYGSNVVWCGHPHFGGVFMRYDAFCYFGECKDGE